MLKETEVIKYGSTMNYNKFKKTYVCEIYGLHFFLYSVAPDELSSSSQKLVRLIKTLTTLGHTFSFLFNNCLQKRMTYNDSDATNNTNEIKIYQSSSFGIIKFHSLSMMDFPMSVWQPKLKKAPCGTITCK